MLRHTEDAAWHPQGAPLRAYVDVERDFAHMLTHVIVVQQAESEKWTGLVVKGGAEPAYRVRHADSLEVLERLISGFQTILDAQTGAPEEVFHSYLREHPVLLDLYGSVRAKPRWHYPTDALPEDKAYVEPDFIIAYPDHTYRLVELERPDHALATAKGDPRAIVTHAAYQIAEWKEYVASNYQVMRDDYPGISQGVSSMLVVSQASEVHLEHSGRSLEQYLALLRGTFNVDVILTYDNLVSRARSAVTNIRSMLALRG